jgi:cell division protein FtsL
MHTARVLYVLGILAALALWVLWQAALLKQAGYRVDRLQRQADECRAEIDKYKVQVSKLEGPQRVVPMVEKLKLKLVPLVPDPEPKDGQDEQAEKPHTDMAED